MKKELISFFTLTKMMLKEKINISFANNWKKSLQKISVLSLLFTGLVGLIYLIFYILSYLGVLGFNPNIPVSLFNTLFYLLFIIAVISCVNRFTNTIFLNKDNQFLLTLPIKESTIYVSKVVTFYFMEIIRNFALFIPLFIAYGLSCGLAFKYYIWVIICFLVITLIEVVLASLFSNVVIIVRRYLRGNDLLTSLLLLFVFVTLSVLMFYFMKLVPEDLQLALKWTTVYYPNIVSFSRWFEQYLIGLTFLPTMIFSYHSNGVNNAKYMNIVSGESVLILTVSLVVSLILIVLISMINKPIFIRLAALGMEHSKKDAGHVCKINPKKLINKMVIVPDYVDEEVIIIMHDYLRKVCENNLTNIDEIKNYLNQISDNIKFNIIKFNKNKPTCFYYDETKKEVVICHDIKKNKVEIYRLRKPNKNAVHKSVFSLIYKDMLIDIRNPRRLVGNYLMFIAAPMGVLLLNTIFKANHTSSSGQLYIVVVNYLIIVLFTCATNTSMASAISRDGNAAYLYKTSPHSYAMMVTSKMILRASIMTVSIILTMLIYHGTLPVYYSRMDILILTFLFIYYSHLLMSMELDIMHPKSKLYRDKTSEGSIFNSNEMMSGIYALVLAVVIALIAFFFLNENLIRGYRVVLAVALLFLIGRVILFYSRISAYHNKIEG